MDSSVQKQVRWSPEEDELMVRLRNNGMKWEDIGKIMTGRSGISCRLHYQNYLEKPRDWDEEKKNRLALLYKIYKHDMWDEIAVEMGSNWRVVESMHWQFGREGLRPSLQLQRRFYFGHPLQDRHWDNDDMIKLTRLYKKHKPQMWNRIAQEMNVPWRAADFMHWELGDKEIYHRVGERAFSGILSTIPGDGDPVIHSSIETERSAEYTQFPEGEGHQFRNSASGTLFAGEPASFGQQAFLDFLNR